MINSFRGKYAFLSNFHFAVIELPNNGKTLRFPTSEHCFMSFKNESEQWKLQCQDFSISAPQIKALGKKIPLIENWNETRLGYMTIAVHEKFNQNPNLLEKLLATGDQNIVEGNWWNDKFWGVCIKSTPNEGENHLGRIIMDTRSFFRKKNLNK